MSKGFQIKVGGRRGYGKKRYGTEKEAILALFKEIESPRYRRSLRRKKR